ncbi:3-keto-disaccharide hydrolase [Maribellus maritimus]|uniref:3-keto-disaccharide hydrolase n=1 Tax=Maribellus maritimus TaxID=2870838 RepID=UPI001EEC420E|nr:DUF1080 domain-containing protein [Maribellus maritimus]MCG6186407.1 DUF1080 domain-containing protein [Maribellus maritimus]
MRNYILTFLLLFSAVVVMAQEEPVKMKPEMTEIWDPEVSVVTPGETPADAPSDAIVLFDGVDLESEWTSADGAKPGWTVEDGCVTVKKGAGVIKTKRVFWDFQLHIEWRAPAEVVGKSQGRGNSGIFLQELYEVQVLDNYDNRTYRNGQAGSLYKQHPPLVNVCKKPGQWQTYDIIYTAPRFNEDGTYFTPPTVTVLQNGVLVQNNVKLRGPTEYIGIPEYFIEKHGPKGIVLQDHGNPVSFRNIWIREL